MKKTALLAGVVFFFSVYTMAQQTEPVKETSTTESKYKLLPMPAPLTIEKTFPVIGTYQFNGTEDQVTNLKISLDEQNKGLVWLEGLPEGKIKAQLRKSPATYKIPNQKTEDGKSIAEGTLIYDKDNNQLQLCFGCNYNSEDPALAFAPANANGNKVAVNKKGKVKNKIKVTTYTGTKVDTGVASNQSN